MDIDSTIIIKAFILRLPYLNSKWSNIQVSIPVKGRQLYGVVARRPFGPLETHPAMTVQAVA